MTRIIPFEKYCDKVSRFLLWSFLVWVPVPLGSNRPIFWVLNAFFSAVIVCSFLLGNARHLGTKPSLKLTTWLAGGFTIVVAWMLIQSIPISSGAFSHPLRDRLSQGILKAYGALSADPAASLTTVAEFAPPVFLGVVAAFIGEDSRRISVCLKVIVLWGTLLAAYGLAALYFNFPQVFLIDNDAYPGSLTATFVGRGAAATYFAIALVCAVALLCGKLDEAIGTGRASPSPLDFASSLINEHGVYLVAIAILLCALLNTGSRAGTGSGLAGLFVVLIASWRSWASGGLRQGVMILFVSLAIAVVAVSSTHLVHRLETVDLAADVRFLLYKDTLRMIAERPVLGHGAGVFADLYPVYQSSGVPVSRVWNKTHDTYLQAASELGLPVLLLLLSIAAASIWRIVRGVATRRRPAATATAALGAFTVAGLHSIFDFSLQIHAVAITFAVVAGAGYGEANRLLFKSTMAPLSNSACIPSSVPSGVRMRTVIVVMLLVGVVVMVASAARLGLIVSAVPQQLWLMELSPLILPYKTVKPSTTRQAEAVSRLVRDPALITARIAPCRSRRAAALIRPDVEAFREATKTCLAIIDDALAVNPLSSELWLERSKLLFGFQGFPGFLESLRRSYETSPRVGWIAAARVIVGLQSYQSLPADLKMRTKEDLELVLSNPELAGQVIALFVADESFREVTIPIVESLKQDAQRAFLGLVKERINSVQLR